MTIQEVVDGLAARLQRSVVIDDAAVHLLYTSPHYGDEDEVRIRAVLQRQADSSAVGHVLAQGVTGWTAAGVIPAKPEIGFRARVCVPIRWHSELLGLLIVLDADGTLTTSELTVITATAQRLGDLMIGPHGAAAGSREAAVADLLSPAAEVRRAGLPMVAEVAGGDQVRVVRLEVRGGDLPHIDIALRRALSSSALFSLGERHASVLWCTAVGDRAAESRVTRLVARVEEVSDGRFGCVAGIGAPRVGLAAAWLSHREAELACRAAGGLRPESVVRWSSLGTLGVLLRLPPEDLTMDALPDELRRLLAVDPRRRLTETLRAYLDSGGSGPGASEALHIHRTTLYYRLERITALTGLDLADGRTRLALHLGLDMLDVLQK